jgi:hypothetical protein
VLWLAFLPVLVMGPVRAADDPTPSPAGPEPTAEQELVTGVEGSKAALVRIEVSVTAEIAHFNHDTGDIFVVRGRYDIPIRSATGVFVSADGVIATAGRTLTVSEDQVVVPAANRLFAEQIGVGLVGNDGDPARPAHAVDPHWDHHLQDCYGHIEHCVLFFVTHYKVFPHTQSPVSTPADALPQSTPDVGLLRISGGGGTPTAVLAPPDQALPEQGLLTGFLAAPAPDAPATELAVRIDPAAGTLASDGDFGPADAGLAGGPVLAPDTGEVVGLATNPDGVQRLVPVAALHQALTAAGVQPNSSPFDAVFRRGVDHLSSGQSGGSAASAFEESLAYYPSALAAQHLGQAQASAEDEGAAGGGVAEGDGEGGTSGGWLLWFVVGLVVLFLLAVALVLRRRRSATRRRGTEAGIPAPSREPVPLAATTAAPRPEPATGPPPPTPAPMRGTPEHAPSSGRDRTRLRESPAMVKDPVPRARQGSAFCSDCGARLRDGARFCASCGSPAS